MARKLLMLNVDLNEEPTETSTISGFLSYLSIMEDSSEKMKMLDDFLHFLEHNHKRIMAFQHHFYNCMQHLREMSAKARCEKSKCHIQLRLKQLTSHQSCYFGDNVEKPREKLVITNANKDWLHDAKLWTTPNTTTPPPDDQVHMINSTSIQRSHENETSLTRVQPFDSSSPKNFQVRKKRIIWTSDLCRKFVRAVDVLGGPKVAKPKNIQALMQVDGLTTEQIKSHLQNVRRAHIRSIA